jgi:hypothetical protein
MWIRLKRPYKIISIKEKRYHEHYHIPASQCLIVPLKRLDEEVSCCVYWQDSEGLHSLYNMMFTAENLEPIDESGREDLVEIWSTINK